MDSKISSAKELMISRYEAFVRLDGGYLKNTTTQNVSTDMSAYENLQWLKLDILDATLNQVEFKAYFRENNKLGLLHERSNFTLVEGEWKYVDGEMFNSSIQRNEDCPCGSGKKYKKCCINL